MQNNKSISDEALMELFSEIKKTLFDTDTEIPLKKYTLSTTALWLRIIIESAEDQSISDKLIKNFHDNLLKYNKEKWDLSYNQLVTILNKYFHWYKNILNKYLEEKKNWKYNEFAIGCNFIDILTNNEIEAEAKDGYILFITIMELLIQTKKHLIVIQTV